MPDTALPDPLLFGHDATERIVAVQTLGGAGDRVRVYRRLSDDTLSWDDEPVHPYFFLSDLRLIEDFPRERYRRQALEGDGHYRHLLAFESRGAYWDALRHVERAASGEGDAAYTAGGPEQQYLTQTGRTLFKGMALDDLRRLQLDIEVAAEGTFPSARNPAHAVVIVAMSDNRGWNRVLDSRGRTERELLAEMVDVLVERDPDVIEGHNIYGFDLPYLSERCRRAGVRFAIGRDGTEPRSFPSAMRFAERTSAFDVAEIAGRHVVDTLLQVQAYDVVRRDLPNYTLKGVARYFGFAEADRTYVEGRAIARTWREDPDRLVAYALDDVLETGRIAKHLSGSTFYLTQMVPMAYGTAVRTGPAAKIEALLVRGYLHARQSLPRPGRGGQMSGGYTDVFVTGVVGPIVYADVESLYPSIMLHYDVRPASDALGLFPEILRSLTALRLQTKADAAAAAPAQAAELDARQQAFKIVINSFYGSLGFSQALFNDHSEADRVARTGQELLRGIIETIRTAGGRVIEVDTDGVFFVPPPNVAGEDEERRFVSGITDTLPTGIRVGFDGRFRSMLSLKKKNYALLGYDGSLKFRGSSLVSRSTERFGRRFVREVTALLLAGDVDAVHKLYLRQRRAIDARQWDEGVESFQRAETLKSPLEDYERDVAAGRRARAAAYELAKRRAAAGGRPVRVGERVAYYVARGAGARGFEAARFAQEWDPTHPDESTAHYLDRLDQTAQRFEPVFTPADFRLVFSEEDLFGFDASAVSLRVVEENGDG